MPSLGLHWVMYATYASALLTAAVRYVRDDPERILSGMLGFAGALGLVTGMYYVGRSAQFQLMILFPVWALCPGPRRLHRRAGAPLGSPRPARSSAESCCPPSRR